MQRQPYFTSCALDTSIWGKGGEHSRAQLWKICEGQVYFSILSSLQSAMPSYTTTDLLENLPYCSHHCLPCSPTLEKLETGQQAAVGNWKNQSRGNREATATTLSSQSAFSLSEKDRAGGGENIWHEESTSEVLSWTRFISELRLYFKLKMPVKRPVYYLRGSRKVMGPRKRKIEIICWLKHTCFFRILPVTHTIRVSIYFFYLKTPAVMEKQMAMSSTSITFCKLFTQEAHQKGNSAALMLLSYPVFPIVHHRYFMIEDNWGFFCPSVNIMTLSSFESWAHIHWDALNFPTGSCF